MHRFLLFSCLSLGVATSAAAFEPGGLYLGITGTFNPGEVTDAFEQSEELAGGMFGAQVGYRFPMGMFVPGMEADYLWGGAGTDSANGRIGIDQMGTLRATLGMPIGPLMPYLTGGAAIAQASVEDTNLISDPIQANTHLGYVLGGGVELGITSGISVRGEYNYIALGEMDYVLSTENPSYSYDVHAIKLGVNFNF